VSISKVPSNVNTDDAMIRNLVDQKMVIL